MTEWYANFNGDGPRSLSDLPKGLASDYKLVSQFLTIDISFCFFFITFVVLAVLDII